jgi:hypothetical protein
VKLATKLPWEKEPTLPVLDGKKVHGVMGEFDDPHKLVAAAKKVRGEGYSHTDALIPFPVHGLDEALGIPRSHLGYICLTAGALGTLSAYLLIWYTGAVDYPLIIGGKPLFSVIPSIPVMFELTVLFAAFAAVFGMIGLNGLPRFYHPTMNYSRIAGATDDKFLLVIEGTDPKFDPARSRQFLESIGARNVELLKEGEE